MGYSPIVTALGGSAEDMIGLGRALTSNRLALLAPQAPGQTWYPYSFLALARHPGDLATSLAHYEEVMTPIARRYQSSAVSAHRALLGTSSLVHSFRHWRKVRPSVSAAASGGAPGMFNAPSPIIDPEKTCYAAMRSYR